MKTNQKQVVLGTLLILAGLLFLLQQIFHFPVEGLFIALIFVVAGAGFIYVFIRDHKDWWAFIPGFTLLGLGALIASDSLLPAFTSQFGGSLFLGSLALSFLAILLFAPQNWWAEIPAGVLATLALIAGIHGNGMLQGSIFFLGIGATFAILTVLPANRKQKWPWIPAVICFLLGSLLMIGSGALLDKIVGWVWSIAFLVVGVYMIVRSMIKNKKSRGE